MQGNTMACLKNTAMNAKRNKMKTYKETLFGILPTSKNTLYHRERILETSTLSCNEEEEEITKPPKR
jgi:hypothetical protein